ncbi:hypothetical protein F5Y15DRAFT_147848 [Xylariaceae sp. FL0016]|nr:hypothetical protein F5Y15DRAFT_147848 [Xylariaceae sp. FL0016]
MAYSAQYYTTGLPIPSAKDTAAYGAYPSYGYYPPVAGGDGYSVSPPELSDHDASVSSGGASYSAGAMSSSRGHSHHKHHKHGHAHHSGGHHGHYAYHHGASVDDCSDSAGSASGVDFNDYMQERFADSFDPLPLDRSLAVQAQTSGGLNAKHRELLELQVKAQARLAKSRARFADGLQDAQEVRANLEWTSKKVSSMKKKAEKKHSKEYQKARQRYPSPEY